MAVRMKTTVVGDAFVDATDDNSDEIVTFQYADLFSQASPQQLVILMNSILGALFSVGQQINIYIAVNSTEITQIEASGITVTPLTAQD